MNHFIYRQPVNQLASTASLSPLPALSSQQALYFINELDLIIVTVK